MSAPRAWAQPPIDVDIISGAARPTAGVPMRAADTAATRARKADEQAWKRLRDKHRAEEKSAFETALSHYQSFLDANPKLSPSVAADVVTTLVQVRVPVQGDASIKVRAAGEADFAAAFALLDEWEPKLAGEATSVSLSGERARLLLKRGRAKEAAALLEANWARLQADPESGRTLASSGLAALDVLSRDTVPGSPQRAALVESSSRLFVTAPSYLNAQKGSGAWHQRLVSAHIAAGEAQQALAWAKLAWCEAGYNKGALSWASKLLAKAWLASDATGAQLQAWTRAQSDNTAPNPLRAVPLPVLDKAALQQAMHQRAVALGLENALPEDDAAMIASLRRRPAGWLQQERLSVLLAQGQWVAALDAVLSRDDRLSPQGKERRTAERALDVCRVLKAADGDLLSANAYLKWLAQPAAERGPSPLDAWRARNGGNAVAVAPVATPVVEKAE